MKRILCCLLCAAMLFPLASCGDTPAKTSAPEEEMKTEEMQKETSEAETKPAATAETAEAPQYDERADDPLTPEKLAAIPIANASMTTDQLRQICVEFMCLSTTFQWLPADDFSYETSSQNVKVTYWKGKLYGGIPYVNTASGNLYRILEYYDPETAILDISELTQDVKYFGTACSGTACTGWQRVVNSATCKWTYDLNVSNGLMRVGSYTYDDDLTRYGSDGYPNTLKIAAKNGKQTMYESYAQTLPGDCMVCSGHVRMVKEKPVVVRNADGTINGTESYIIHCEQGLYTTSDLHNRFTADGTMYKIQGNDYLKVSFGELYSGGYLPHTFKEFHGLDPVEDGSVAFPHSGETATPEQLQEGSLTANYSISDVFMIVCSAEGEEIYRNVYRSRNHFTRAYSLTTVLPANALVKYCDAGTNTIEIKAQLMNGELLTVYSGTLVKS